MKTVQEWISKSPEETAEIAQKLAAQIKPGTVIALSGNLGSGKTTFIKGLAVGFGAEDLDAVTSPTFALMHVYSTKPRLYHFDLYRLDSVKDVIDIGFEEFVSDPGVVTCVEWAEKAAELMPKNTVKISFDITDSFSRKISVQGL